MNNFVELVIQGTSLQILQIEEMETDAEYIAVPFGFRSLPLIMWAISNGRKVLVEDPWETTEMLHYPTRPAEYAENVSVAQLWMLELRTREYPVGITKFFNAEGLDRLPQLREEGCESEFASVEYIEVGYKILKAGGDSETVKLSPDYFIFEDANGVYNVFYQDASDFRTQSLIDSAADTFMRPQQDFEEFGGYSDYGSEWAQDCLIAQLRINAALSRGDTKSAVEIATYQLGIPPGHLRELLAKNSS